ncbi:DNA/RNA-binding protein KIN17 [Halotydeus destructor]|nr:DNA/RNA-binding protein KIN17 [Halotydeus destructor]
MPKHEPMTAKAIGKKIKSKGLQKLKYFCQMCQKQCRDANGFKCHMTSEAHQRQLLLVAENPGRYLGGFSDEFLKDFLYLLKTRFGTRRVLANQVYQEYIKNREHVHMNATRWVTLTGLCKWMGRKGIATVEENEKGWFITYIDRDPETLKKQENLAKKDKMEKDYEERMAKIIEEQVERGKLGENPKEEVKDEKQELKRDEETKITFSMPMKKINPVAVTAKPLESFSFKMKVESAKAPSSSKSFETNNKPSVKKEPENNKRSALDEIMEEEEAAKSKEASKRPLA